MRRLLSERCQCPRVSEETATYRQAHSDDGQTFQKIPLPPGSSRSEKLRSPPPGLANVPPAHFGDRKSARRGCRGRRGTRGLLQREISTGVQQAPPATFCLGQCATTFWSSRSTGVISCHAAIAPSRVGNATYAAEEQRPSCVVHMDSADSGILATEVHRKHGRVPAVGGDVLTSKFLYRRISSCH